ncbi:hypothetical protein BaRGS_00026100 [Batillaria attramentaria]|uniref:Uncharacterized protein n=1 Tax=Batillaria attramentaria TaxID=370345 RepID=A0ABD0K5T1_9CAEN
MMRVTTKLERERERGGDSRSPSPDPALLSPSTSLPLQKVSVDNTHGLLLIKQSSVCSYHPVRPPQLLLTVSRLWPSRSGWQQLLFADFHTQCTLHFLKLCPAVLPQLWRLLAPFTDCAAPASAARL